MSMALYTNGMGGGGTYYSHPTSDSPESPIVSETTQTPAGDVSTATPLTKLENDEAAKRLKEAAENMGTYFRLERELKESKEAVRASKEAVRASKEAVKAAEDATDASRREVQLHKEAAEHHKSNADAATKRAAERQAKLDEIARKKAEALQKLELLKAQRDAAAANVSK